MSWALCATKFQSAVSHRTLAGLSTEAVADDGKLRKDGSRAFDSVDEERSRSRVMQGFPRNATWTSHRISEEEIEQLQRFFMGVLELPRSELEEARGQWEHKEIFVRSLGHRVPAS